MRNQNELQPAVDAAETATTANLNRRSFLKTTSLAAGAVAFGVPTLLRGQNLNSKLNIVTVGAWGKGQSDTNACADENILALCDVDTGSPVYAKQTAKYPNAKFFRDYREMFDKLGPQIDGVTIATPDHLHAIVASAAMRLNKPVYCQKPLTQTVYEARYLRKMAAERKLVTQMGNQGSSADGMRRGVEVLQDGLLGQVREVHVWTNRPVWPQAMDRPEGSDPVPATLDWDKWLGPAQLRPYKDRRNPGDKLPVYLPFVWRGWQDYGTGALGDMACHTVNLPFRGLELGYPTEIEATPFGVMNKESFPVGSKIRFEFPQRSANIPLEHPHLFHHNRKVQYDAVTLWWYDGGQPDPKAVNGHDFSNKPPEKYNADIIALLGKLPNSGSLIVGDNGTIFSPDDYGMNFFVKLKGDEKYINFAKHPALDQYPVRIPRTNYSKDVNKNHTLEWIHAIKENKPEMCYSSFEIGSRLTEIMLLGCVSLRTGKTIEWDGPKMEAKNCPEAAPYIKRVDRAGWELS